MSEGIERGIAAAALIAGLQEGRDGFTHHMVQQFFDHQTAHQHVPFLHATLALVAEHSEGGVVGGLVAYPPVGVISQLLRQLPTGRRRLEAMLSGGTAMARVKALGVDNSHRNAGLGTALLQTCRRVYNRCEYSIVYGQMPQTPGLDVFYRKNGFEVLDSGGGFDAWVVFGSHALVQAPAEERIFIWRK
ncbi:GNAT family N-acetyltransferase [Micromonosporaceae bacterium DT194]|uniref:GNAT family N-acetyltransferase n=1 Tax=Melissospora conviva TaxID=3388432 RepID=UPI003C23B2EE